MAAIAPSAPRLAQPADADVPSWVIESVLLVIAALMSVAAFVAGYLIG